jgi:hypothetical protein
MFEVAISRQTGGWQATLALYIPWWEKVFVRLDYDVNYILLTDRVQPNDTTRFVDKCQKVIERVAGTLIREKRRKMEEAEEKGQTYQGKDLLSLLRKYSYTLISPPETYPPRSQVECRSRLTPRATDLRRRHSQQY